MRIVSTTKSKAGFKPDKAGKHPGKVEKWSGNMGGVISIEILMDKAGRPAKGQDAGSNNLLLKFDTSKPYHMNRLARLMAAYFGEEGKEFDPSADVVGEKVNVEFKEHPAENGGYVVTGLLKR